MRTANMESLKILVCVILEQREIHMKDVMSSIKICAVPHRVESGLNVKRALTQLNASVLKAISEILMSIVLTSTSVQLKFALKMLYVSIRPEAMIVNVKRTLLEILSKCVLHKETSVTTLKTVHVMKKFCALSVSHVNEENVKIFAITSHVDLGLLVITVSAFVHLDFLEMLTTPKKVVC